MTPRRTSHGFSGASGADANLWISLLSALGQKKLE
jgi:hypothetical protein